MLTYDETTKSVDVVGLHHVKNKDTSKPHGEILDQIEREFTQLLRIFQPTVVVREKGFSRFARETQALYKVMGMADMALCRECGCEFEEIAPLSVKKLVAGSGKASKEEVKTALATFVGEQSYETNDESDAVAVGIAWLLLNGFDAHVRRDFGHETI